MDINNFLESVNKGKVPKPQLVGGRDIKMVLKGEGNLIRSLMIKCNVSPNAFRCPGAMALDVLQCHIRVEGVGGT